MLCCIFIIYWLIKYLLTPLHKGAVIGKLKRFDHFKRGSLSGFLLIDSLIQHHCMTVMYRYCNSEQNNDILLNPPIQFRYINAKQKQPRGC